LTGSRSQGPGLAMRANRIRIERVHIKRKAHELASRRIRRKEVPQVRPEVIGVRTTTRGSCATEEVVLNTGPMTLEQRVTPTLARRGHRDGDLTVGRGRKPCTGTESQSIEWQ
jgi:hypothetical protein